MTRTQNVLGLAGFLAICYLVSAAGAWFTLPAVENWYPGLAKPPFNPPDWIFGPVWTLLYAMMAIAGWRIWCCPAGSTRTKGLVLFAFQLTLNLAWSVLFFGYHQIGLALLDIFALLVAISLTALTFHKTDRLAGLLFIPYILWVGFATLLNFSIWILN